MVARLQEDGAEVLVAHDVVLAVKVIEAAERRAVRLHLHEEVVEEEEEEVEEVVSSMFSTHSTAQHSTAQHITA